MATVSKIEWTGSTWNPITGCDKISAGCDHCYAERMARRLHAMGQPNYRNGFKLTLHPDVLRKPLSWRQPRLIFVGSMTDIFHKDVPFDYLYQLFSVMKQASQHVFQVLTKRSGRLAKLAPDLPWPENVWMGVTVESRQYVRRIDQLRETPAQTKFLSLEPLIGPLPSLNLLGIDWAIVGGESGPGARPVREEWVLDIRDQCQTQSVPFFFKQWGGINKKKAGRLLQGRKYSELPNRFHEQHPQITLAL